MSLRIIHITRSFFGGGGEYALRLSEALRQAGHDSSVISLDGGLLPSDRAVMGRIYKGYDRVLTSLINRRSCAPFSSFLRLSRFTAADLILKSDIVHLHSITGFIGSKGLRSLIPMGAKVFWIAHNPWTFTAGCVLYQGCDRYQTGCSSCPILKFPVTSLSKLEYRIKSDFIRDYNVQPIANSEWIAAKMRKSPWFSDIPEIPIIKPIVQECFHPREDELNRQNRTNDEKMIIGLGARSLTDSYKGIKEFFENIPLNSTWIKKAKFHLFGEGELSLHPSLDVQFLGPLRTSEAMAAAYNSMDLYVSPTAMETFGMTLVEAQACGTPVIAFNTGGTPEAVCPSAGWLVENGKFNALYELIKSLTEMRGNLFDLGLIASQWVALHHGSKVIAGEQFKIYS